MSVTTHLLLFFLITVVNHISSSKLLFQESKSYFSRVDSITVDVASTMKNINKSIMSNKQTRRNKQSQNQSPDKEQNQRMKPRTQLVLWTYELQRSWQRSLLRYHHTPPSKMTCLLASGPSTRWRRRAMYTPNAPPPAGNGRSRTAAAWRSRWTASSHAPEEGL